MSFSWLSYISKPGRASSCGATLESLPYELLEQIFREACTDGGRTGCSLSLVSKRIRALSRSSRFHSVSLLTGTCSQLSCFLDTLERAREEAAAAGEPTPRVRHLCILLTTAQGGFIPPGPYFAECSIDVKLGPGDLGRKDPLSHAERRVVRADACAAYQAEINRLFASIGTADLQTLYAFQNGRLFSTEESIPEIVCPDGFRRLRELTLHPAYAPIFVPAAGGGTGNSQPEDEPFYPALERLHIRLDARSAIDFAWWAANAPALEHLRVACDGHAGESPKFMPSFLSALSRTPYNLNLNLNLLSTTHDAPLWWNIAKVQFMYRADFPSAEFFGAAASAAAHAADSVLTGALRRAFAHVHPLVEFGTDYRLQDVNADGLGGKRRECRVFYNSPDVFEPDVVRRDWLLRVGGRAGAYTPGCWADGAPPDPRDTLGRRVWTFVTDERVQKTFAAVYMLWVLYPAWPLVARLVYLLVRTVY
ncbi:hypothetical protein GY45DRAFT_1125327 [Cubamyces sp. BRFM 1775]|nr:hypothetical protein GY45DRAFT_1125327 [Cubamyces sp. BRFM 1775]